MPPVPTHVVTHTKALELGALYFVRRRYRRQGFTTMAASLSNYSTSTLNVHSDINFHTERPHWNGLGNITLADPPSKNLCGRGHRGSKEAQIHQF